MVIRRGPLIIITTLIVMKSNQHKKGIRACLHPTQTSRSNYKIWKANHWDLVYRIEQKLLFDFH